MERGYNAVNQIVGYLLSGDPAYVLHAKMKQEIKFVILVDVIMEELVSYYLKEQNK
ncbi:IreB family regulatory phosphoprotein [Staphylococcus aureus]